MVEAGIALSALYGVRRGYGELGVDFVEGMLGGREAELVLEEGGLGRVSVGVGEIQALHRIQQLLSLLDEAGNVEHDGCMSQGAGRPRCSHGRGSDCNSKQLSREAFQEDLGGQASKLEHGPQKVDTCQIE